MTAVILFVFGAIIGSFLNVLALRASSGLGLTGRSHCLHCAQTLGVWELIPIFSFFFLRGRCRMCRTRLSWQYPLVELWAGLIFISVPLTFLPAFCLYVAITIYDFRHKIIPDRLVYWSILLALISRLMSDGSTLDWLAGPILFLFLATIWLLSRGRAIGFGDAKLALSVGLLLGATAGFSATILSFWLGAAVGILILLSQQANPLLSGTKRITMKSEIPFAPFIVLGAWLAVAFQLDLFHVSFF